jgi:hypothetical protein
MAERNCEEKLKKVVSSRVGIAHLTLTALPAAMRYIIEAESYHRMGIRRKTVLHNSRKCCTYTEPIIDCKHKINFATNQ